MTLPETRAAYGARADEYAEVLGSMEATAPCDRELVARWAEGVPGEVVDVGCGPGQWTAFLRSLGCDAYGIDPVQRFVEIARQRHPEVSYKLGSFADLRPESVGGVLSWYSVIHLEPAALPEALTQLRDALRPGGSLLLGFFGGERVEPFDHAVTTAYYWPPHELARSLESLALEVVSIDQRHEPGARPAAAIIAVRR